MHANWLSKLNKKINYLVAVSGGPDSMFLLDNLVKNGFNIIACHVNYHRRWSSKVDEEIVQNYCKKNHVPLELKSVVESDYAKGNFQDQARVIRYNFFNEMAHKHQVYNLIVAHHIYDLIETYLIQKQRKAIVSYYGLKFKNTYRQLSIYRPMLELKKEDIMDYLTLYRVKYGFDETNEMIIYERNRIRLQQINKLTDFDINIMLSEIKELNSEQELIKDELEVIYNAIIDEDVISVSEFKKYEGNYKLQQMIIYEYILNYDQNLVLKLKKAKIKEIVRVLTNSRKANFVVYLNDKICLFKEYNFAYISHKPEIENYNYKIKRIGNYNFAKLHVVTKKPNDQTEYQAIYVSKQDLPLTVRINTGKEEIVTNGGTKKINRLFVDNKIPYRKRMIWPVVLTSDNVVITVPNLAVKKEQQSINPNLFLILK